MTAYTPIGDVPLSYRFTSGTPPCSPQHLTKLTVYVLGVAVFVIASTLLLWQHGEATSSSLRTSVGLREATSGDADEIFNLPGKPTDYSSRLFSGYLSIGNGGQAFYFFAESQSKTPQDDPVMLWLNGGPGASSLSGCFTENGPLIVNGDGETLRSNKYAWNMNANLICIESPVGVGFSYNASGVYQSDDLKQADELYLALQSFYGKFPALRKNAFIITGESYGGIYVPTTAKRIVEGNEAGQPRINLTKFVVGNGVNEFGGLSMIMYAYYHGLLSTEDYLDVRRACPDFHEFKPSKNTLVTGDLDSVCANATVKVFTNLYTDHINTYNIYSSCIGTAEEGMEALVKEILAPHGGLPHPIGNPMTLCLDSSKVESYFNLKSVREAMHTDMEIERWSDSVLTLTSSIDDAARELLGLDAAQIADLKKHRMLEFKGTLKSTVRPLWRFLLDHHVQGVIYHGDADISCDFIGGLWAVESMGIPRKQKRSIWTAKGDDGTDQTAGFLEDFGDLKYVTVKGAGHLVPQDKPMEAKQMLDLFVLN